MKDIGIWFNSGMSCKFRLKWHAQIKAEELVYCTYHLEAVLSRKQLCIKVKCNT
uniref:Uncharacterized protein n=1 Tax=Arundo donax TaxID=35708 RepID=A0A0A9FMV9_ARUDO